MGARRQAAVGSRRRRRAADGAAVRSAAAALRRWGQGRGGARRRARRNEFQSCQTEALNLDDAGAGLRFSRLGCAALLSVLFRSVALTAGRSTGRAVVEERGLARWESTLRDQPPAAVKTQKHSKKTPLTPTQT